MKLQAAKIFLCIAFAALTAGAWDMHIISSGHAAGEDCQVCAVAAAPELNADCGSVLLADPDDFVLAEAATPRLRASAVAITAFLGRAPPR